MNSQDYIDNVMIQAKKAFANHTMRKVNENHWKLRQLNTNIFWVDIIVIGGSIVVYGDIDICCFAYYSGKCSESAIEWMSKGVGSYEREKALIGMSHIGVDEYDVKVATHDLEQRIKDAKEYYDEVVCSYCGNETDEIEPYNSEWENIKEKYEAAVKSAIDYLNCGNSVEEMQRYIYDDFSDLEPDVWEWMYDIGRVISPRVIYALAAIQRLNELIKEGSKDAL